MYAGNLADLRGLLRSSFRVNVAKQGNDKDDNLINHFKELGELNVVILKTAARTDSVGEMGTLFLADARQTGSTIHQTIVKTTRSLRQRRPS
jgi:hypothetical protein